jgi:hypothetical protein
MPMGFETLIIQKSHPSYDGYLNQELSLIYLPAIAMSIFGCATIYALLKKQQANLHSPAEKSLHIIFFVEYHPNI